MKIYGLLGHKINYSLSPAMQNAAFQKLGIKAEYRIFDISPKELDNFLKTILRSDIHGLNVTVPHKIRAFEFVKKYGHIDKETNMLGALNTICIENKSLQGHNTDTHGFIKALKIDLGFSPRFKNIFIFGSGGAGSAIAMKLARASEKIFITDAEEDKIKAFSAQFYRYFGREKLEIVPNKSGAIGKAVKQCALAVNATPYGKKENELLVKPEFLHLGLNIYDLIYTCDSPLVKKSRAMGLKASNGLSMLLYQGARSFELWTKKRAPVNAMKQALLAALRKE